MAHLVLARKWRPKKFADLVGQQQTRTILQNILSSKRLHHAYLLTGTRGVGKTTIARIIAKALNCLDTTSNEPCGTCTNCQSIDAGRFVDVIEIDAASNTGVDNVRELIDDAKYAPSIGMYKIYIIDEVHMLSKSAFNAMLKTLEEPPAHAIFILATTDPDKVPITILSRCLQLKLRNLLNTEIINHLKYILSAENVTFEDDAMPFIAASANGSMRDALSLLDQAIAFSPNNITASVVCQMLGLSDNQTIFLILDAIKNSNVLEIINIAKIAYEQGDSFENILTNLRTELCNISIAQLTTISDNSKILEYSKTISINDIQLYFEIANLGLEQLERGTDKYSVFIMTLLRMVAFKIGNNTEKQIILQTNNFNVVTTDTASTNHNKPTTAVVSAPNIATKNTLQLTNSTAEKARPTLTKTTNSEVDQLESITKKPLLEEQLTKESDDIQLSLVTTTEMVTLLEEEPTPPKKIQPILTILANEADIAKPVVKQDDQPNILDKPKNNIHVNSEIITSEATQPNDELTIKIFNGDWFHLIIELKKDLGYLYPVLENAKLITVDDYTFDIIIDSRYEDIMSSDAKNKVIATFDTYFGTKTNLIFSFAIDIKDTLKEKSTNEVIKKQLLAEQAIQNDDNLNKILHEFSATIIPGSIKSI